MNKLSLSMAGAVIAVLLSLLVLVVLRVVARNQSLEGENVNLKERLSVHREDSINRSDRTATEY